MHYRIQRVATILLQRNPINPSALWRALLLTALACFAVSPMTEAVSPPPDGGYLNFTTAEGQNALLHLTNGSANTAVGWFSLENVTTGSFCTGVGAGTLLLNTADENTATGAGALLSNTVGFANTANGALALFSNTDGEFNTATGVEALNGNSTGDANTANGFRALVNNTSGSRNTANGVEALFSNQTGTDNTANGFNALVSNTTGSQNTANGTAALISNTIGGGNTASGAAALVSNTEGSGNNALGQEALVNNTTGTSNNAFGTGALPNVTSGNNNTAIGHRAGEGVATGNGNVYIGAFVPATNGGESDTTRIRNIYDSVVTDRVVYVNQEGKLGTLASSRRFKDDIKPMNKTSEALFSLEPVTFRYKKEIDSRRAPQFGLVAEEVEKVCPDLVVRDMQGQIYSVRYEAVNAMLLNEFLKQHRKVEEQGRTAQKQEVTITELKSIVAKQQAAIAQQQTDSKATAARQQEEIKVLTGQLKKQASQIQQVSTRLQLSTAGSQMTVINK
jgi:hypothetical protein